MQLAMFKLKGNTVCALSKQKLPLNIRYTSQINDVIAVINEKIQSVVQCECLSCAASAGR